MRLCMLDHVGRAVRVLVVAVLINCMTETRERTMARRRKPYCHHGNVQLTGAAAAATVARDYCDPSLHRMTSRSCPRPAAGHRTVSPVFRRLLKLVVSTRRRYRVHDSRPTIIIVMQTHVSLLL